MLLICTATIIFYTLALKSKCKLVGFVCIQNAQHFPKFPVYSPKFLGFFPAFKNCGFFATLVTVPLHPNASSSPKEK